MEVCFRLWMKMKRAVHSQIVVDRFETDQCSNDEVCFVALWLSGQMLGWSADKPSVLWFESQLHLWVGGGSGVAEGEGVFLNTHFFVI